MYSEGCCICLDEVCVINPGSDNPIVSKPIKCETCTAIFHSKCITDMLLEDENYEGCPVCRESLPDDIEGLEIIRGMYGTIRFLSALPITKTCFTLLCTVVLTECIFALGNL